jgi:hypothetical protein
MGQFCGEWLGAAGSISMSVTAMMIIEKFLPLDFQRFLKTMTHHALVANW